MIRVAGVTDLAALCALEDASFVCDGVGRRAMAGFIRSPAAVVLMDEVEGQLRGHAVVRFNARTGLRGFIRSPWRKPPRDRASGAASWWRLKRRRPRGAVIV